MLTRGDGEGGREGGGGNLPNSPTANTVSGQDNYDGGGKQKQHSKSSVSSGRRRGKRGQKERKRGGNALSAASALRFPRDLFALSAGVWQRWWRRGGREGGRAVIIRFAHERGKNLRRRGRWRSRRNPRTSRASGAQLLRRHLLSLDLDVDPPAQLGRGKLCAPLAPRSLSRAQISALYPSHPGEAKGGREGETREWRCCRSTQRPARARAHPAAFWRAAHTRVHAPPPSMEIFSSPEGEGSESSRPEMGMNQREEKWPICSERAARRIFPLPLPLPPGSLSFISRGAEILPLPRARTQQQGLAPPNTCRWSHRLLLKFPPFCPHESPQSPKGGGGKGGAPLARYSKKMSVHTRRKKKKKKGWSFLSDAILSQGESSLERTNERKKKAGNKNCEMRGARAGGSRRRSCRQLGWIALRAVLFDFVNLV